METKKTNKGLVAFVLMALANLWGYVYGEYFARIITEDTIQAKAKQYPKQYTLSYIQRSRKWIGKKAGDCTGLAEAYLMQGDDGKIRYNAAYDRSANGWKKACKEFGPIDTIPEIPGVLVFMPGHVGVYVGSGDVVESRGVDYGVVKTALKDRPWQSWGKIPEIEYVTDAPDDSGVTKYVVQAGDSPWSIAAKLLGDGRRYTEIVTLNGLEAPYTILTGQILSVPSNNSKVDADAGTLLYTVKQGDSPWSIAAELLGSGKRYVEIEQLNGLEGKYDIYSGQVLAIPAK